ncbi:MAG: GC-type dockerin domain-anchored protein [Phycisphaerales bacterium]|nr:hypothetical protein [Phycisphaeraceae bacterium]
MIRSMLSTINSIMPALILVAALCGMDARAQSGGDFDLTWYSVDGGGEQVGAGDIVVFGTVGQGDVDQRAVGGGFTVVGGFWTIPFQPSVCPADIANTDGEPGADGAVDNGDFTLFFNAFFADISDPIRTSADIANTDGELPLDGVIDNGDFSLFFSVFFQGCP